MTVVDLSYNQLRTTGNQYVYLKDRWEDSWTLYPHLHCTSAVWSLAPTIPTATCVFDYGNVSQIGVKSFEPITKLNCLGAFIKIVLETDKAAGQSNTWWGVVCHVEDEQMGIVLGSSTGRQTITAYGLEKLLDTEYISESWVDNGEFRPRVIQLPVTFNRGGRPNKNTVIKKGDFASSYVFDSSNHAQVTPEFWSTYDIVKYLLTWVPPKESFLTRTPRIPFQLSRSWLLMQHDKPEIQQEGHTIASLLSRLIDRRRLRSYYLEVDETADTPYPIYLMPVAWNRSPIDPGIDGADVLAGNDFPIDIIADYNQSTGVMLRSSSVTRYDRVLVRGARRTSTVTLVADNDSGLEPNWTSAEETAYESAASGESGYAGWDDLKQQQRNAEVRSASKLSAVYSWFKLPDDWNYKALKYDSASATNYVFLDDDDLPYTDELIHEVVFEPFIPLWEHVDYSADVIATEAADDPPAFVYRQPFCAFKVPTDARWVLGDAVGLLGESSVDPVDDGRNFRWSAGVYVQPDTRTLEVRVSGEPQHVIAYTDWHGEKLDEDRELGEWDYRSKKMAITATLRDNRYAEAIYPPLSDGDDTSAVDYKYGFVIYAGDGFRCDYIVPNTIVDIDTHGTPLVSTGGYVRDDRDILESLARVAYEWFSQYRVVLTLTTTQLTSEIQLGNFVEYLGDTDTGYYELVNTMVSEIRIAWPLLEGNQTEAPRMEIITGAGELDPMTLAPKEPKSVSKAKARIRR